MPPITQQQSSRGGLITTIVILSVTSLLFLILWIVKSADDTKKAAEIEELRKSIATIAPADIRQSSEPRYERLRAVRDDATSPYASQTLIDVALSQRDAAIKAMTGSIMDPQAAIVSAANALVESQKALADKKIGVTLPSQNENVLAAIQTLTSELIKLQEQSTALAAELEAKKNEYTAAVEAHQAALSERDKQLAAMNVKNQELLASANLGRGSIQSQFDALTKQADEERKQAAEQANQLTVAVATAQAEKRELERKLDAVLKRLATIRVDVKQAIMAQVDGQIVRLPGDNIAVINRGQGQQVAAGLTFEVYDQTTGIPTLTDADIDSQTLPRGKASIEVIRVGASSSEARITRLTPGEILKEGDLIVNLVYDPNTRYNFAVYGEFDLDQNGVATAQDAEVVKRLITQWGSSPVDVINVDTDFLVMGKEPVVPTYTAEELQDPIINARRDAAIAAADAYAETKARALELNIPVLNQNRFLYFIGYYEQAKR